MSKGKLYIVTVDTGLKNDAGESVRLEALVRAKSSSAARGVLVSRVVSSRRAGEDDVFRVAKQGGDIWDAEARAPEAIPTTTPEPSNE